MSEDLFEENSDKPMVLMPSLERIKLWFEFFKHLTTLDTACILLMSGLLETKVVPTNLPYIPLMFSFFVLSLIVCLWVMLTILTWPREQPTHNERQKKSFHRHVFFWRLMSGVAVSGFMGGLLCAYMLLDNQRQNKPPAAVRPAPAQPGAAHPKD
jgi:hypothetical protein